MQKKIVATAINNLKNLFNEITPTALDKIGDVASNSVRKYFSNWIFSNFSSETSSECQK